MKCPICNNPLPPEHDRMKCVVCGFSKWDNFQVRWPTGLKKGRMGETHRRFSKGARA